MFPLGHGWFYGHSGKLSVDSPKIRGTPLVAFLGTKCHNLGNFALQESTVVVLEVRNQRVGQACSL